MIRCGWCGKPTANLDRCSSCGHEDPARPWTQRGQEPPPEERKAGRPKVDAAEASRRLAALPHGTDDQLAEHHGVDPRTVRLWREKAAG